MTSSDSPASRRSSKSSKSSKNSAGKTVKKTAAKLIAKITYEPFDWQALEPSPVIGVDEVGRGCLAGPVFAAAVILPAGFSAAGLTDSKLLSAARREYFAALIHDQAQVGIGFASVGEIDRLNILGATFVAMRRAIENLAAGLGHVLVDGNQRIPLLEQGYKQTTLIKGDLRALPVAAASVVAKVARDSYMKKLAEKYPVYGFDKHKGYAAPIHVAAIQAHGPCVQHRSTFAGVREHWSMLLDEERAMDPF
jgi:ribonuclease HII